jgi:ribosomal protein S18 acetylase RimI-like enzyme
MVDIRPYSDADLEQVKKLIVELQTYEQQFDAGRAEATDEFAAWYLSHIFDNVRTQQGVALVAEHENTLCGFAAGYAEEELERREEFFYISELVVTADLRGHGIGSSLIRAIEEFARSKGFKSIRIGVLAASVQVYDLYKRLGFQDYAIELIKVL